MVSPEPPAEPEVLAEDVDVPEAAPAHAERPRAATAASAIPARARERIFIEGPFVAFGGQTGWPEGAVRLSTSTEDGDTRYRNDTRDRSDARDLRERL